MRVRGYTYDFQKDILLGNNKVRERRIAQYAIAGTCIGMVIHSDHAGESVGFFSHFNYGGADVLTMSA